MNRFLPPVLRFALRLGGMITIAAVGIRHVGSNGTLDQTVVIVLGILALVFPQLIKDYLQWRQAGDQT